MTEYDMKRKFVELNIFLNIILISNIINFINQKSLFYISESMMFDFIFITVSWFL